MVDVPNKQSFPPAATPGVERKPPVAPMELATNAPFNKKYSGPKNNVDKVDPATLGKDSPASFKLPDKVTPAQIRDQSFKYGGGKSAGNRSLKANHDIKDKQP